MPAYYSCPSPVFPGLSPAQNTKPSLGGLQAPIFLSPGQYLPAETSRANTTLKRPC